MPARSSHEIRASIEETRRELSYSVGDLQSKLRQVTDWRSKLAIFASYYAGLDANDGQFHAERLLIGYGPWAAKRYLGKFAGRPRLKGLPISLS